MAINAAFLGELENEAATCRKVLERVPESVWEFKPHEKSANMGALAAHVAEMWSWVKFTLDFPELDFGGTPYAPYKPSDLQDLLAYHDRNVAEAKEVIARTTDETMMETWTMRNGEQIYFQMPKVNVLRTMVFNHIIHHRGALSVYLRLNDIPVPSIYGPSADEGNM